ncbi:putative type IX sorting system protein PorV2 [Pararhodonellum marinum]|uniref:putative type IX sorting system protein PorV2 n=1 Tax=Pararhodonellum marinum TaxID=2755358 RepID=UPI00189025B0|nr:PorV/PorQ family protein [Pararhodonellum marinum]
MKAIGLFIFIFYGLGCFIGFDQNSHAQSIAPKYSNEFLNIGVGARALGMGGAQVSATRDVTAAYWNPAGILGISHQYEFALMHAEYFAGIAKYDYAGFSTPLDEKNQVAVSLIRFGVDDIPDTRFLYDANGALNYNNIRFFNAADYALILSYARDVHEKIKVGANTKIIHRNVGKFAKAWGFGLDLGAIFLLDKWQLGAMLRDVTTTFNAWTHNAEMVRDIYAQTNNEVPLNTTELTLPQAILSATRNFKLSDEFRLQTVMDLNFTFDGRRNTIVNSELMSIDPRLGLEFGYKNTAFLRGGFGNIQKLRDFDQSFYTSFQPSFGIGVFLNELVHIDYALSDIGSVSETPYSHVFSVKVALKKLDKEYRSFKGWPGE